MVCILTYLLNLFDLYMTRLWVNRYGISVEGNPFGRWLLITNLAIPFKVIGIGMALLILYFGVKRYPKYRWTGWVVFGVYALIAIYHIVIMVCIA